jgi:hypothetical protein
MLLGLRKKSHSRLFLTLFYFFLRRGREKYLVLLLFFPPPKSEMSFCCCLRTCCAKLGNKDQTKTRNVSECRQRWRQQRLSGRTAWQILIVAHVGWTPPIDQG